MKNQLILVVTIVLVILAYELVRSTLKPSEVKWSSEVMRCEMVKKTNVITCSGKYIICNIYSSGEMECLYAEDVNYEEQREKKDETI